MLRSRSAVVLLAAIALLAGGILVIYTRLSGCKAVPGVAPNLLPNAGLAADPAAPRIPAGWGFRTGSGVEVQHPRADGKGFDLDGDDNGLQLIGIANYLETPAAPVSPATTYCFAGFALTDSPTSATRVQVSFRWLDAAGALIRQDDGPWQDVAQWRTPADRWSALAGAAHAPDGAAQVRVRLQPASDDRLYFDTMRIQRGAGASIPPGTQATTRLGWPAGAQAALSFSFDYETTMGGLIHSRSLAGDDPYNAQDPRDRGMRMRQGVTETLTLFEPLGIRATYYSTGYNFLDGNAERQTFMGDPVFVWATPNNRWKRDWSRERWFATDPHGTIQSDPDYYFGDLVADLRLSGQDIQSHTFAHLYGALASPAEWQADFAAWNAVAAAQQVPPARSLAFPWSSSGGMSDANWKALEAAGIASVTRTNRSQSQYRLTRAEDPFCRAVPGHETILACPDFYLTETSAPTATALLDAALAQGGMLDLWAHTEEVVSPGQIAAWGGVVRYAAEQRDAGRLWIAPLSEIADWQQSTALVGIQEVREPDGTLTVRLSNRSGRDLSRLTVLLPFAPARVQVDGQNHDLRRGTMMVIDLPDGNAVEVRAWPV